MSASHRFYSDLARWWPLVSPVEDYAEEAAEFMRVLGEAAPAARTLLELGSGGGHNAFYLKERYQLTLTDLSDEMLAVSRALNPECRHERGDMRDLDLGEQFDIVFVHDAIDYMTHEGHLAAALGTAVRHCRPEGVVLVVPDHLKESYEPSTDCGGSDGPEGEGIRYLEWSWDPDPGDNEGTVAYSFLIRERDGRWSSHSEEHRFGLFTHADWLRLMHSAGLDVSAVVERTAEERSPRIMFLGRRRLNA